MSLTMSSELWKQLYFLNLVPEFLVHIPPCETETTSFQILIPEANKEQYMREIKQALSIFKPEDYSLQFIRRRGAY